MPRRPRITVIELHLLWWHVAIHILDVEWWVSGKCRVNVRKLFSRRDIL